MPRIIHRPKLLFTPKNLDYLTRLSRSRNQAASIVERSRIVLLSYREGHYSTIARDYEGRFLT